MPSCTCSGCVRACENTPGWFAPGEAERAAELLGMELPEFFKQYLSVQYDRYEEAFVLAPRVLQTKLGGRLVGKSRGTCVFLENDRCRIHAAKPYECADYMCDEDDDAAFFRRGDIAGEWWHKQEQIAELLGGELPSEELARRFREEM